ARRHARDDLVRVPLEVGKGALLLDPGAQELRALLLAPEADQEAGQRAKEEGRRRPRELTGAIELGHRLVAVDLEDEPPIRGRDPADGGEDRHRAVVDHLAEGHAAALRARRQLSEGLERAALSRPTRWLLTERGQVHGVPAIRSEEQRLA